jgi:hypothetical protein
MRAIHEPKNPNELWCGGCERYKFAGLFTEAQKSQEAVASFLYRWIKSGRPMKAKKTKRPTDPMAFGEARRGHGDWPNAKRR